MQWEDPLDVANLSSLLMFLMGPSLDQGIVRHMAWLEVLSLNNASTRCKRKQLIRTFSLPFSFGIVAPKTINH